MKRLGSFPSFFVPLWLFFLFSVISSGLFFSVISSKALAASRDPTSVLRYFFFLFLCVFTGGYAPLAYGSVGMTNRCHLERSFLFCHLEWSFLFCHLERSFLSSVISSGTKCSREIRQMLYAISFSCFRACSLADTLDSLALARYDKVCTVISSGLFFSVISSVVERSLCIAAAF